MDDLMRKYYTGYGRPATPRGRGDAKKSEEEGDDDDVKLDELMRKFQIAREKRFPTPRASDDDDAQRKPFDRRDGKTTTTTTPRRIVVGGESPRRDSYRSTCGGKRYGEDYDEEEDCQDNSEGHDATPANNAASAWRDRPRGESPYRSIRGEEDGTDAGRDGRERNGEECDPRATRKSSSQRDRARREASSYPSTHGEEDDEYNSRDGGENEDAKLHSKKKNGSAAHDHIIERLQQTEVESEEKKERRRPTREDGAMDHLDEWPPPQLPLPAKAEGDDDYGEGARRRS